MVLMRSSRHKQRLNFKNNDKKPFKFNKSKQLKRLKMIQISKQIKSIAKHPCNAMILNGNFEVAVCN
jgi:hypothetical protein